ncbi:hypothetical protein HHO38_21525 [Parabacteroides distasonis]|jgi:hypothetical protein|uniref:Lipoprotein n=1 Tax=Parabacteroides distasonis TaxID=823 RepID=A0A7L5EJG4_PARDI|nr:hypothetical protein [Parabacteroides distasonis]MCS2265933.1 hypothetical protein [Bacteroides fragilis]DAG88364.1 MAG TPA: Prokaryotic membrane lipoprotein lipid attachment site [Herelleviridae sp.]DAX56256.1 MAG TPA: Prokaryotic membrane lipoprotein lipid attachment site [Caudoviricetes sp.]MCR1854802.1 hypothetical protein [Parabacteroides distasonis]MDB8999864.1 hypothetical protein [Parabacteroides distasonis]
MKHLPLLLLLTFIIGGCASSRLSENVHQQDSVQIKVETRIEYVPDTVYIEIPAQTAERETADSTSHLENDYATSDARINPDGTLFHNLKTKPQKKPVEFEKPVEHKDSIVYKTKTVTKVRTVEVPHELTWWEKTQIYGFWFILFILMIVYRKKVFYLVKWFI